jgi:TAT (twin-arginine translocation) pathway signal sequence
MKIFLSTTALIALCSAMTDALSTNSRTAPNDRRSFLVGGAAAALAAAATAMTQSPQPAEALSWKLGDPNSVVGREIRSFNDLVYNFKNTALDGGLDASKLKEPSIPFIEFGERMKNGDVEFVEFIAPNGDVAYATFKKGKPKGPIRIGQGYPVTGKNSWSSPDYVIRSVVNFGVPYKFTVPGLAKFSSSSKKA